MHYTLLKTDFSEYTSKTNLFRAPHPCKAKAICIKVLLSQAWSTHPMCYCDRGGYASTPR